MTFDRKNIFVALAAACVLLVGAVPAQAGHNPPQTVHCRYELGSTGDALEFSRDDPAGVTADGSVNVGGCFFEMAAEDPWTGTFEDGIPVDGDYTAFQAAIVDDVFGNTIGGRICSDVNDDLLCGNAEHEIVDSFCGTSPVYTASVDTDGDGHKDFGNYVVVVTNGPLTQAMNCDPVAGPVATSGGILNPSGGVFMTLAG